MNRFQLRAIALGLLGALALIFVLQNTEVVPVRFLFWELAMSRVVLILGALAIGFTAGLITSRLLRPHKSRAERGTP